MITNGGVQMSVWVLLFITFVASLDAYGHQVHDTPHFKGQWEATKKRGLWRLGSRRPSCEHKCGGCTPCVAVQVPTTADSVETRYPNYGTRFANYEPEGWKCKCGSTLYNP